MDVLTSSQMRDLEQRAFASGHSPEDLMEQAGAKIAAAIRQFRPVPGTATVFFGKGHNGGDALVAARHLRSSGWKLDLHPAYPESDWSELTRKKHVELGSAHETVRRSPYPHIVLDGLLGIGAANPLRDPILSAARDINALRLNERAAVFAIDLPTGVDGENGHPDDDAVTADFTLTVGYAKTGLLRDKATRHVGRLVVLPLEGLPAPATPSGESVAVAASLGSFAQLRDFDTHKGDYGRVGIVAGSLGTTGAAVLSASGALRTGAGLVYLYVPREVHSIAAAMAPAEVMVHPIDRFDEVLEMRLDALAIGPGLGTARAAEIRDLVQHVPRPAVIDADALNALAEDPSVLWRCAGQRLLTPHPGEMARLFPNSTHTRAQLAVEFAAKYRVTLLLKGARTVVAHPEEPLSYNTTGTPGMATGGMGDVLTGVCAALIARHLRLYDAARLGAWVCGRAAEVALVRGGQSEESLIASDVITNLGIAFQELRRFCL